MTQQEQNPIQTKKAEKYEIATNVIDAILEYLSGCPYKETYQLIAAIYQNTKPIPEVIIKSPEDTIKDLEAKIVEEKKKIKTPEMILEELENKAKALEREMKNHKELMIKEKE